MKDASFGFKLYTPVDTYQQSIRALKYAILFIFLTFLSVLLFEIFYKLQIHPIQYLLVGFAMSLFYLLFFSISEHSYFLLAYILSSIAVIAVITAYCMKIFKAKRGGYIIGINLTALYGYLYFLLTNEDYALLFGAIGLFITLAFVMYITRNVDWYTLRVSSKSDADNS